MYIYLLNINTNVNISDNLNLFAKYVTSNFVFIALPVLQCRIWIQLISQHRTINRDFNCQNRDTAWSKSDKYWNYWVLIMYFGLVFGFVLLDIDLRNIDLLDTHLYLILVSPVNVLFLYKTSWRRVQNISSKCLQDMSSRCLQDMSSRRVISLTSILYIPTLIKHRIF